MQMLCLHNPRFAPSSLMFSCTCSKGHLAFMHDSFVVWDLDQDGWSLREVRSILSYKVFWRARTKPEEQGDCAEQKREDYWYFEGERWWCPLKNSDALFRVRMIHGLRVCGIMLRVCIRILGLASMIPWTVDMYILCRHNPRIVTLS